MAARSARVSPLSMSAGLGVGFTMGLEAGVAGIGLVLPSRQSLTCTAMSYSGNQHFNRPKWQW